MLIMFMMHTLTRKMVRVWSCVIASSSDVSTTHTAPKHALPLTHNTAPQHTRPEMRRSIDWRVRNGVPYI